MKLNLYAFTIICKTENMPVILDNKKQHFPIGHSAKPHHIRISFKLNTRLFLVITKSIIC